LKEFTKEFGTKNNILIDKKNLFVLLDNVDPSIVVTADSSSIQLFQQYRWRWINNKMITEYTGSVIQYDRMLVSSSQDAKNKQNDPFDMRLKNLVNTSRMLGKSSENAYRQIDHTSIALQLNQGVEVIIDRCLHERIKDYRWLYCEIEQGNHLNRVIKAYVRDGAGKKIKSLYLDRYLINCTDRTMLVKHLNGDILDCRLENMVLYMRRKSIENQVKTSKK
jgi:hypothetical protein